MVAGVMMGKVVVVAEEDKVVVDVAVGEAVLDVVGEVQTEAEAVAILLVLRLGGVLLATNRTNWPVVKRNRGKRQLRKPVRNAVCNII